MRRSTTAFMIACLLGATCVSHAAAGSVIPDSIPPGPPYPEPIEGVSVYDYAGVMGEDTIDEIEATIAAIKERSGAEIVVYLQVKPESDTFEAAEADAAALVHQWGVGRWGADDGLVILSDVYPSLCHGQLQLYAGRGFDTAYMPQAERQAAFEAMLPALRECDWGTAMLVAMERIDAATTFESVPVEDIYPSSVSTEGFSVIAPEIVRGRQDIEYYLLGPDPDPGDSVGLADVAWATGHTLEDMTQAWGGIRSSDGDLQFELTGWQIPGVDTKAFSDAFRTWALGRMGDPVHEEVEIAGKLVTVFDTEQTLGSTNYMHANDDIVWLFAARDEYAADILGSLPGGMTTTPERSVETPPPPESQAVSLGGRVDVPSQGYALTPPDSWISMSPTAAAADTIVDTLSGIDPDLAATAEAALASGTSFSLLTFGEFDSEAGFRENCNVIDYPSSGDPIGYTLSADAVAVQDMDQLASGPETTILELPAGDVGRLDYGLQYPDFQTAHAAYYFTDGSMFHLMTCTDVERPADDWLSIAETFEFLDVDAD